MRKIIAATVISLAALAGCTVVKEVAPTTTTEPAATTAEAPATTEAKDLSESLDASVFAHMGWDSLDPDSKESLCNMYVLSPDVLETMFLDSLEPVGGYSVEELTEATMHVVKEEC
jgi:restriction endonuclease Mrr